MLVTMMTTGAKDFDMKRQAQRISVALPVELENGKGVTRDVSVSGVFFETDLLFSLGTPISFFLILEHADPVGPIRIQCQGNIVRVEPRHGKLGVAVAIDSHRFSAAGESSTAH